MSKLSGHSLRAGFITSAADNRATRIMEVSRHRDSRSVETYVRRADRYNRPRWGRVFANKMNFNDKLSRSKTSSIWPGLVVHVVFNGLWLVTYAAA